MSKKVEQLLESIAIKHITTIETLSQCMSDGLDFHEIAVWELKAAIEAAYKAGQESVK